MSFKGAAAICVLILTGCASSPPQTAARAQEKSSATSEDQSFGLRNQGFSLLYQLLSDEKNLSKLLLIKKEQADTGELLREISEVAGAAVKQMDAFAKADPHLHLDMAGLPAVEAEARELISKTDAKELITKGGEKFEVRILITQADSLRYGAALATATSNHDSDTARKAFLADTTRRLEELHQKLIDLLHARWRMPPPPK